MNAHCIKCHRPWIAPIGPLGTHYICPECEQKELRAKFGKSVSVYPKGVTVTLLEGRA